MVEGASGPLADGGKQVVKVKRLRAESTARRDGTGGVGSGNRRAAAREDARQIGRSRRVLGPPSGRPRRAPRQADARSLRVRDRRGPQAPARRRGQARGRGARGRRSKPRSSRVAGRSHGGPHPARRAPARALCVRAPIARRGAGSTVGGPLAPGPVGRRGRRPGRAERRLLLARPRALSAPR